MTSKDFIQIIKVIQPDPKFRKVWKLKEENKLKERRICQIKDEQNKTKIKLKIKLYCSLEFYAL